MKSPSPVIVICGPTAVGKSECAVRLAERLGGEILSADSQQVYKEMDIGTGKPPADLRERVPHFGFDLALPNEGFDAAKFLALADQTISEIQARKHIPFVVGGTGLYLRVLQYGLSEAPPRNASFREHLRERMAHEGSDVLYRELSTQDPAYAATIHPNDKTRIIRALEITQAGFKPSQFFADHTASRSRYHMIKIGLNCERSLLYQAINQRVEVMIKAGWLEEVSRLVAKYGESLQAFKAVGYAELLQHLRGEMTLEAAVELIQQRTRNYAKRQLTWFRQDAEIQWFLPHEHENIFDSLQQQLNQ